MTTTVFTIFNDYLEKLPGWKSEAIKLVAEKKWDTSKINMALRILSSIDDSDIKFQDGRLQAKMSIFMTFAECNMLGRTSKDLSDYISGICKEINEFSSRLHFRFFCCSSYNSTGGTMEIGWEF